MLGSLPAGVVSTRGYLGCLAGLELGQEAAHPLAGEHTLVPSTEVTQGCTGMAWHGMVWYGWGSHPRTQH